MFVRAKAFVFVTVVLVCVRLGGDNPSTSLSRLPIMSEPVPTAVPGVLGEFVLCFLLLVWSFFHDRLENKDVEVVGLLA